MTVTDNLKEGGYSISSDGNKYTRVLLVTELTGDAASRLYNASQASGVPRMFEPHPTQPFLVVTDIDVSPDAAGAKVTVTYSQPSYDKKEPDETELPIIQVGSTVQESETSRDKDGKLVSVKFIYTPVDEDGNQGVAIEDTYVPVLSVQTSQTSIEYQRRENKNPVKKSILYVGKVNSVQIGIFATRTLLCTGIEGQSNDGGVSYSVSYRFQYAPKTWDAEFYYIDQETGQPHKDVTIEPANGYGVARVYAEIDFRPLNVI